MFEKKLNEIYGKIAEVLNDTIPEDWNKIYMYGEILDDVQKSHFYYYPADGSEPVYSHDIPEIFDIDEDDYDEQLDELLDTLTELRLEFKNNGQELWTNLTFILESDGKFNIEYDYTDLSETSPREQFIIWKYKYLGIMPKDEIDKKIIEDYKNENK